MTKPIIYFDNVSKKFDFQVEQAGTILETIISWFSRRTDNNRELWAVRDLTFGVEPGQALGIIGRNGSGKSTLMKLAAGILRPTLGTVRTNGRISALLELGAGFHPDLTGRENIYLNGSLLGLSKQKIDEHYDSIVEFSELGDFINMPVKHYSSGMYMRLGFSVAIHIEPDILIIDEILAVGDQAFQNKCAEQIFKMKREGVTIVLVTHELSAVRHLCSHLIWMDKGQIRASGPTNEVVPLYLAYSQQEENKQMMSRSQGDEGFRRWGTGDIEITKVRLLNKDNIETKAFRTGGTLTVEINYKAYKAVEAPEFGLALYRDDGLHVSGPNNRLAGLEFDIDIGEGVVRYHVPNLFLLPASYRLTVAIHDSQVPRAYDFHEQAYGFRVVAGGNQELYGLVQLPAEWEQQVVTPVEHREG
ncbi:MAG TPA: ABC transporter ATP-binding protein [Anaerolineae bacterium]|nr:ABC transporter ATP-binding protein [Anaerolineae bacterium]